MSSESESALETSTCSSLNDFPKITEYGPIITIRVGRENYEFPIHKGLLSHHSLYFKNLFNGNWEEGKKSTVDLPDEDLVAFKLFFSWLYTRRLYEPLKDQAKIGASKAKDKKKFPLESREICKAYILGDRRQIPALKNAAIDAMVARYVTIWSFPNHEVVNLVYENTLKGSQLRLLIVDMWVMGEWKKGAWDAGVGGQWAEEIRSRDFPWEICAVLNEQREHAELVWSKKDWLDLNTCNYHDHSDIHEPKQPAASST